MPHAASSTDVFSYESLASAFAYRVMEVFATEDSMKEYYGKQLGEASPFDRTHFWNAVIPLLFEETWKMFGPAGASSSTLYDKQQVASRLQRCLDYSLFTQVLLNLYPQQFYGYDALLAGQLRARIQEKYKDSSVDPLAPKAVKIKNAKNSFEVEYNTDLSALKAASVIEKLTATVSYRVSPMGTTPAFADSANLSMLGQGADQFLRVAPGYKVGYATWAQSATMIKPNVRPSMTRDMATFQAENIDYPFSSKSGGQTLNDCLFSRYVAHHVWENYELELRPFITVLPRMNSVMVVAKDLYRAQSICEAIGSVRCPSLVFTEDSRPEI
jgi:hypothetical protein